jgi:hypothetical protein
LELVWNKPVVIFYKERRKQPERKALAVVKARKLLVSKVDEKQTLFDGNVNDFFPLMGDIDYICSKEGMADKYVICWFDDEEDDFTKAWRRLTGVTFPAGAKFATDRKGKRTYDATFKAEQGKLE